MTSVPPMGAVAMELPPDIVIFAAKLADAMDTSCSFMVVDAERVGCVSYTNFNNYDDAVLAALQFVVSLEWYSKNKSHLQFMDDIAPEIASIRKKIEESNPSIVALSEKITRNHAGQKSDG